MSDDATLSAFAESTDADGGETGETEPDRARDAGTDLSTYAWGSYACRRCGNEVERVWRDDGDLVCSDCKSW